MAGPGRSYAYHVYLGLAGTGGTSGTGFQWATWPDAGPPAFECGFDGPSVMSVPLPRLYGAAGEVYDWGADGTLLLGNRVDLYVSDEWSRRDEETHALTSGRLVYRGTLERYTFSSRGGVTAEVTPLSRIAAQTAIDVSTSVSGDPAQIARTLWQTYGGALGWDSSNPAVSGATLAAKTLKNTTLLDALRLLASAAGPTWHAFVSPAGQVRFFDDSATAVHVLTLGSEVTDWELTKSTVDLAKRVLIAYTNGTTNAVVTSTAADRDTTDPRDVWVTLPSQAVAGWAQAIADAELRDRDRVHLSGEVTVSAARYPIDTIAVGDRVRLRIPRDPYAADDSSDFPAQTIRIAHVAYGFDSATLTLDQAPADITRQLTHANRTTDQILRALLSP